MKMTRQQGILGFAFAAGLGVLTGLPGAAYAADDTIVWGKPGEITGFDAHVAGTVASWQMYQMVYETLLTTDDSMALQPGLAESWEQTSPTSYVFKIRPGAAFSNGRAVVAADVIGSLMRIKNPETASYWTAQLGTIAKIEAPNDHTVTVELEAPHTAFLAALAHVTAAIMPIKELEEGSFDPTSQLMGSGPFMVANHKQDESWSLTKNPHYWRKDATAPETLSALIIPDDSARMAALRDGRIDFTTFSNPDVALMLARDNNIEVLPQQTTNYYRMDVNAKSETSAFHDIRVRQAFNLALDRDAINNLVFAGSTTVDYPVPAAFGKDACHNTSTYALSREDRLSKAKDLLAEAGKPAPEITIMATSADPVYGRIAQVAQQSITEAGFKVDIVQPPVAEYLDKVFTKGEFDVSLSWLAGYTDPSMVIAWWNPNFAIWNQSFQEDVPALDTALEEVKSLPDGEIRDAKLVEICDMIDDGANLLALVSRTDYIAYRSDTIEVKVAKRSGSSNTFQFIYDFKSLD